MLPVFLFSILFSALISYGLTFVIEKFFVSRGWVEDPAQKQQKTKNATALFPVPRGGGLPIFIAIAFTSLLLLPPDRHLIGILFAGLLALVIGLLDDVHDISPHFRLLANAVTALIIVASGIGIFFVSNPFGGVISLTSLAGFSPALSTVIPDLIAIFWIVWCMNTVGWAAGIEGQLPGFVSIAAIFIGLLGLRFGGDITQWPVIILAGAVAGAYLGFLPHNFFPQSIMPGYSGKSLAGLFLAILSILSGAKLATLIFLLGIPMLDAVFVIVRRLFSRRSIFISDGSHFHHHLLKIGWTRPRIAVLYWAFSLFFGILALFLNSQQKFYVFLGLALFFWGLLIRIYRRS